MDITDNRKVKQLIVLGNGFDLTCGLKSQYADFYQSENKSKQFDNILVRFAERTMNECPSWADVESNILKLIKLYKQYFIYIQDTEQNKEFEPKYFYYMLRDLEDKYKQNITESTPNDINSFYKILREEVNEFEERLTTYLDFQILDNNYIENSKKLAVSLSLIEYRDKLLFAEAGERQEKFIERNELMRSGEYAADFFTFNYTPVSKGAKPHQIQNIHGNIKEKNTILGIDYHEAEDDLLEFTKTYRLLSHSQVKERIDFSQEFDYIKFFGHSLGEADYSYFQSIFDGLDLYSAKTKLFFYFQVYDPNRRAEIISQNYHAVSKLLKHYGETFKSNPDHGKNLMHKLILEGRLTVKELDCSLLNLEVNHAHIY